MMTKSLCFSCLLIFFLLVVQMQKVSPTSNEGMIKLRVGVPKKDGFTQFLKVVWNSRENKYNVSGFCMDIFNAVVNKLTFKVSLQIEPYEFENTAATYDSLIQQVPTKYDVAVGDITIVANRSQFVDFTLPFTESGVRMLVSVQHGRQQTMWIFVQPFSWQLWLSILLISMLIGSVLLIMERNVQTLHEEHSSFKKQLTAITMLWFPLSQAVLPERKVVANNCSIFVLMVWLLLAFVLMQSYTANLTSILTLDQLQPSFLDVNDLRKGDHYVGYQAGSFVYDLLVQQLKFNPLKLKAYSTISSYHDALKLGSKKGGVTAIFDEVPYLNVFLQKVKSNYIIAGPTYRTGGFGFAFPLNSNLTAHFSRAILSVTQKHEFMEKIEKKYFGKSIEGPQISSASPSLTLHSFSGLFLITSISTLLALFVSETFWFWQRSILVIKEYCRRYFFHSPPPTQEIINQQMTTPSRPYYKKSLTF
ncbi:glutamate receptor 2.9-like [Vicia villosa]|uniref:glutamate receptor 2.9-like n=1 Tax=Vicia villosa TaxID=3911 RepID=UPI00273C0468|nr:glutamate receptor 2.9-like [Vicia villosa]